MADKVEKVIKQADALMKQERYAEAWKMLIPHKEDENVRKRLKWLRSKQEQLKLEKEIAAPVVVKQAGRLGWRLKLVIGSMALCVGCVLFSALGQTLGFFPDSIERTQTKVAQMAGTDEILTRDAPPPSKTPRATETSTDSPTATITSSPTLTFTPSATYTASASPTITSTPSPRPTNTPAPPTATSDTSQEDERDIINMLRGATDLDVVSVEIADGRANGGERIAIITYRSTAVTDGDLGREWGNIFGAVYNAVQLDSIDIDSISVIMGNSNGDATGIVSASMSDIDDFMEGRITVGEFYNRLIITDL